MTNQEKTMGRKFAFQFLFQTQSKDNGISKENSIVEAIEEFEVSYAKEDDENTDYLIGAEAKEFGKYLIQEFLKHETEVEDTVSKHLHRNNLSKLNPIDLTLIKLGCVEIIRKNETPPQVIINDIVELAKCFGESDSYSMINGVLDSVWKSK